jgi:hypothetical protein
LLLWEASYNVSVLHSTKFLACPKDEIHLLHQVD